jgi:hypothetical protein
MDDEVSVISSDKGSLVLRLVAETLSLNRALPVRLVCKDLCDIIGDRVTSLTFEKYREPPPNFSVRAGSVSCSGIGGSLLESLAPLS